MKKRHLKYIVDHGYRDNYMSVISNITKKITDNDICIDLPELTNELKNYCNTNNTIGTLSGEPIENADLYTIHSTLDAKSEDVRYDINCNLRNSILVIGDIPKEFQLRNSKLCGYVSPEGKYYQCGHCEHTTIVRNIVFDEYLDEYRNIEVSFFDDKPSYMLQEEYFLMKKIGFAKISSFKESVNKMYLFMYGLLTPEQNDIIYPR